MTITDRQSWSPYAPRPEDPDYNATSATQSPEVAAPAPAEPEPEVVAGLSPVTPVAEPAGPVAPPAVAAAEATESQDSAQAPKPAETGNCAVRTTHLEDTSRESKPQVDDCDGVAETPHCAPKSAPTMTAEADPEPAEADQEPGFTESAKASATSIGQRLQPLLLGLRPPAIWTESMPSLKTLVLYAKEAPWADKTGPIRASGRVWNWVIAVPLCTVFAYASWLVARPSRFVVLLVLYILTAQTTYGVWLPWFW
ncbi:MAG: hypothetical protein ACRD0P_14900 [Stackebrandtia sp.]